MPRLVSIIGVLAALLTMSLPVSTAVAQTGTPDAHVIQPQEVLRLRIGQFDPVAQIYQSWDSVSGEYRVSPSGEVSIPLLGQIAAAGSTPSALSERLTEMMNVNMGLDQTIDVAVDIASFRDIFIMGAINSPGSYPYAPDMTVLQVMARAGGVQRLPGTLIQSQRSAIAAQGQYELQQMNLFASLATEARLLAEMNDLPEIETPEALSGTALGEELMQREREIKEARDTALQSSISQIESLEALLTEQIAGQIEQFGLRETQLALTREELETATDLIERGLTTANRTNTLERLVADQEVRLLELQTARLRAEQNLNEARRDRLNLTNDRRRNLVTDLRQTRLNIEQTRQRLATEAALFAEATRMDDGYIMPESMGEPRIEITRRTADGTQTFDADRATTVMPDDVIEVRLPELTGVQVLPIEEFVRQSN